MPVCFSENCKRGDEVRIGIKDRVFEDYSKFIG